MASGQAVSHTQAFNAIQLSDIHKAGPWKSMLVEAVEWLADTEWDLLDEDCDGYNGEPREGEVSDALGDAGVGHYGAYSFFFSTT